MTDIRDIGSRLELFVDDWLVDSMSGTSLKLHDPVPQEIALDFDRPWEGSTSWAPVIAKEGRPLPAVVPRLAEGRQGTPGLRRERRRH